jgi:hypothetical protein
VRAASRWQGIQAPLDQRRRAQRADAMATIFYVGCPRCGGSFPCHSELWHVEYALLCPFCQLSFHQEESPMIISAAGERRPGSQWTGAAASSSADDSSAKAESM